MSILSKIFSSKSKIFRLFLTFFILSVAIASLIGFFDLPKTDQAKIWFYNGQRLTFQGVIIEEPDLRVNHTKLIVKVNQATVNGERSMVNGKTLVSVSLYPEYNYGDRVEVHCKLEKPEPFNGFRYDRYLAKDDIYSICSYPNVKLISRGNGDWFLTKIFSFKNKLKQIINSNLPEPPASLFSAIILGSRRGIPGEVSDQFSITGTSHLIAISGLHITIIAAILIKIGLSFYLPRKKVFWGVTVALILYITLIGFPPSAVRAGIMGWLAMLAMYLGRLNKSINALLLAASVMILLNPKILRDDIGFQLSFSAVLGLIYLSPLFEGVLAKFPSVLGVKESLQMTLTAQIATLPLIIYYFGRLSLVGPLANLIVLPLLPYLMTIGFAALFLSFFIPTFSQYFFWPVYLLLFLMIKIIEILSAVPYAALNF